MNRYLLIILLVTCKCLSQNFQVNEFKLKNPFLKQSLINIMVLEDEFSGKQENLDLAYDLHMIIVRKRQKEKGSYDITIVKGEYKDFNYDSVTFYTIGYFYLKKELFIVKGEFIGRIFEKTRQFKEFNVPDKIENKIPYLDGHPEWNYILEGNNLILEYGLVNGGEVQNSGW